MKSLLPLLSCIFLLPGLAKSQTGRVTYEAVINRSQDGTPKSEMPSDDLSSKAWLTFDGSTAIFRQLLPDSAVTIRSGGGTAGRMRLKYPVSDNDTTGFVFKINYATQNILERIPFYNLKSFYLVSDNVEAINWKISQEKKTIGQFKVIRADAVYLGRKWSAWFAPEIPVSLGPWKLHGLPGLILEAEDSSRKFMFYLQKIEVPYPVSSKDMSPKALEGKPISKEEFVRLEKKKKDDQYRFKLASMDAATGETTDPATVKIKFAETIEIYK